jgi:hypothetical protein
MLKEIDTYNIPTWAICYFEYGSCDGLSDDDIEDCEQWLKLAVGEGYTGLVFDWADVDPSFTHSPVFGLACDTIECTVYGHLVS